MTTKKRKGKRPRRDVKVSVMLTADEAARLDEHAAEHDWTRSTAAAVILREALSPARAS